MTNGIQDLQIDSREVVQGSTFFVRANTQNEHIEQAINNGATTLVTEKKLPFAIEQIIVDDIEEAIAQSAVQYYNEPSSKLFLIGITGTCGKTTTSYLVEHIFNALNMPIALMGTIEKKSKQSHPSKLTTPNAIEINQFLSQALVDEKKAVVMEVSSHALDQKRVFGLQFDLALFTNFSHEHLDYHSSLEDYFNAKAKLFQYPTLKKAILNIDDEKIAQLKTKTPTFSYAIEKKAHLQATNIHTSIEKTTFDLLYKNKTYPVSTQLIGKINVYNLLAAISCAMQKFPLEKIIKTIPKFKNVKGRLEKIENVFIDYAHKPDALKKVLQILKENCQGKLICLFGCGGNRDQFKRAKMGSIATQIADFTIITSDNPRTEDPLSICKQIEKGCTKQNYTIEPDRKKAIQLALKKASPEDCILIAGKGHETYQILKDKTISFDDAQIVRELKFI